MWSFLLILLPALAAVGLCIFAAALAVMLAALFGLDHRQAAAIWFSISFAIVFAMGFAAGRSDV